MPIPYFFIGYKITLIIEEEFNTLNSKAGDFKFESCMRTVEYYLHYGKWHLEKRVPSYRAKTGQSIIFTNV